MKKLLGLGVISLSLALAACGGDSDSSGSSSSNPSPSTTPAGSTGGGQQAGLTNTVTTGGCVIDNVKNEVYATPTGCKFANPAFQNGSALTYTCIEGGKVKGIKDGLVLTAKRINIDVKGQPVSIVCAAV